jgi:hypothetical protein
MWVLWTLEALVGVCLLLSMVGGFHPSDECWNDGGAEVRHWSVFQWRRNALRP